MPVMEWTPAMSVGLDTLDEDHRRLIDIINRLGSNAESGKEDSETVRQCLYALMRYAETHFAREETVMKACAFPGLPHHLEEHGDFVGRIRALTDKMASDTDRQDNIVNDELLQFLKGWLNHHILIEDMAYRPYAEHHPDALRAAKEFKPSEVWWRGAAQS